MTRTTVRWRSQLAFIYATAGAAVGLGNIWRFPYITGENGGGIFVLIYLLCVLVLGLPLMMSEILIGRYGRQNPEYSIRYCARQANVSEKWSWIGSLTVLSAFVVLTFYVVITGWVVHYLLLSVLGYFQAIDTSQAGNLLQTLTQQFGTQAFWSTLVTAASILVIAAGVHRGIEQVVYIMFPTLIILLLILLGYALYSSHFDQGLAFLFTPHLEKLSFDSVLEAIGQAFFSLGIALAVLIMYGAYLEDEYSVTQTSILVSLTDTGIAILAGIVIFPIVFSQGMTPDQGNSLIFKTLPVAFGQMPLGSLFAALFFLMLAVAAFASVIGFLEPATIWLKDRVNAPRPLMALIMGCLVWLLSLINIASISIYPNWRFLGLNLFHWAETVTAQFTLPLGGLLLALFCGWRMPVGILRDQLRTPYNWLFWTWLMCLRFIAPIGIVFILVNAVRV